ncbi:unnamed protein product, partial [Laminaria digitata]
TPPARAAEAGWEKVTTPDGRPYYQNMVTIETSWEKPPGWVDPEDEAELEAVSSAAAAAAAAVVDRRVEPS